MRVWLTAAAMLALGACASSSSDDGRFTVGQESKGYVMIGVAEASDSTAAGYTMMWRRVDPETGRFEGVGLNNTFEVHTNSNDSVRIRGIPGEFESEELPPGVYALDNVYALIRDRLISYYANGVVVGPERPSFEVRAGEAVYLGIWEVRVDASTASTRLWRLDGGDLRAASRAARETRGEIEPVEARTISVECTPHRQNPMSQRQVC
jgi:hypothetical protein